MSIVYIEKFQDYQDDKIYFYIKKVIESLGIDFANKKILLKPNMLVAKQIEAAVTTHPVILENVVKVLLEKKGKIYIGDSSGIPINPKVIARQIGIMDIVNRYNIEFVDFSKSTITITRKANKLVKTFTLPKIIQEVDYILNLPKLKTHVQAIYTGALKNLFGCVPGLLKPQFHVKFLNPYHFAQMIVDLDQIIKPCFTLMDGIIAMQGEGPSNGEPKKLGVLLASKDMVAMDSIACHIIGLNPYDVPIILKAFHDKLGEIELSKITLQGITDLHSLKDKHFKLVKPQREMGFKKGKIIQGAVKSVFTPKPIIKKNKCVKCYICVKVCPVQALMGEQKAVPKYDYKKCIRCYCCHEMCPEGAIFKKSNLLTRLIFGA